jgi:hypothetical protein
VHDPTKLGERTEGPYTINIVHVNGTVTIELSPGVTERINVRRIIPYRETEAAWLKSGTLTLTSIMVGEECHTHSWLLSCEYNRILLEIRRFSKRPVELLRKSH